MLAVFVPVKGAKTAEVASRDRTLSALCLTDQDHLAQTKKPQMLTRRADATTAVTYSTGNCKLATTASSLVDQRRLVQSTDFLYVVRFGPLAYTSSGSHEAFRSLCSQAWQLVCNLLLGFTLEMPLQLLRTGLQISAHAHKVPVRQRLINCSFTRSISSRKVRFEPYRRAVASHTQFASCISMPTGSEGHSAEKVDLGLHLSLDDYNVCEGEHLYTCRPSCSRQAGGPALVGLSKRSP